MNMTGEETDKKLQNLGAEVMDLLRDTMAGEMKYLIPLIYLLQPAADGKEKTMGTDGVCLYYNPVWLIRTYVSKAGYDKLKQHYLHILSHCMLSHIFERPEDKTLLDSACDVAAGMMVEQLTGIREEDDSRDSSGWQGSGSEQRKEIRRAAAKYSAVTFRNYCIKNRYSAILEKMGKKQKRDDHSRWEKSTRKQQGKNGGNKQPGGSGEGRDNKQPDGPGEGWDKGGQKKEVMGADAQIKKMWAEAINSMLAMMPSDQAQRLRRGLTAGTDAVDITAAEENRSDYRALLRSYMLLKERRIEDPEMIDTDWYTLGINLYGNIPIIEYPESSEAPVADDIVIAIDTSGSCGGETTSRFLRETCNMIRDLGIGRERVNIRILECDAEIENEIVIHSEEDLSDFEERQMHGFGGTSFVPVFQHIDKLLEDRKMNKVRCLLYLSDTYGDFPEQEPGYDTIFVVPEEEYRFGDAPSGRPEHIPEWVRIVVLTEDDLKEE